MSGLKKHLLQKVADIFASMCSVSTSHSAICWSAAGDCGIS